LAQKNTFAHCNRLVKGTISTCTDYVQNPGIPGDTNCTASHAGKMMGNTVDTHVY